MMAETPDFDQIATRVTSSIPIIVTRELVAHDIAEQLRLVWNARGAADIVKLEATLATLMGGNASGPYVKTLDQALRTLDR